MIVLLILICTLVIVIKFSMLKLPSFQPACYGTSNGSEVDQQTSDVRASSPDFKCVGSSRLPFPPVSSNSRHPLKQNQHVKMDNTCQYTQINQYLLKRSIGQGSYGIVQLAHDTLNNVDYVSFYSSCVTNESISVLLGHEDHVEEKTVAKGRFLWPPSSTEKQVC